MPPKPREVLMPGDDQTAPVEGVAPADDIPEDEIPEVLDEGPTPPAEGQEEEPTPDPLAPDENGRYTRAQVGLMTKEQALATYGNKSVDYPPGTPLDANLMPCGRPDQCYVVGNVLTRDGWLIGVPVPVE